MNASKEVRFLSRAELRVGGGEGKPPTIVGYAALFNSLSSDLGGFREVLLPGCFARCLADGADVRALVDHMPYRIIGRNKAGTLRLAEDDKGLRVEIDPPDTTIGRDVVESLRRGDLTGMSFGFFTVSDQWRMVDGLPLRELVEVTLDGGDVSVVTYPAYPDTTVAVRSLQAFRAESEDSPSPPPVVVPPLAERLNRAKARLRLSESV